jgi:hypothetical protein
MLVLTRVMARLFGSLHLDRMFLCCSLPPSVACPPKDSIWHLPPLMLVMVLFEGCTTQHILWLGPLFIHYSHHRQLLELLKQLGLLHLVISSHNMLR